MSGSDVPMADSLEPIVTAAAEAYQVAMQQQDAAPVAASSPAIAPIADSATDVVMADSTATDRPAVNLPVWL